MVATNQIKKLRESNLLLGDQPFSLLFELFKNTRKTPKSSNPVLSAAKPWFSQGFLHIGPIALAVCSAHAGSVHGVVRRLHFASRCPNRVVFRVARVVKTLGVLRVPAWLQNTLAEGVGFEPTVDLLIPRDCNYLHLLIDQLASAWYPFAAILNNLLHRCRVRRPY